MPRLNNLGQTLAHYQVTFVLKKKKKLHKIRFFSKRVGGKRSINTTKSHLLSVKCKKTNKQKKKKMISDQGNKTYSDFICNAFL